MKIGCEMKSLSTLKIWSVSGSNKAKCCWCYAQERGHRGVFRRAGQRRQRRPESRRGDLGDTGEAWIRRNHGTVPSRHVRPKPGRQSWQDRVHAAVDQHVWPLKPKFHYADLPSETFPDCRGRYGEVGIVEFGHNCQARPAFSLKACDTRCKNPPKPEIGCRFSGAAVFSANLCTVWRRLKSLAYVLCCFPILASFRAAIPE